jgi:hypothetical protein
MKIARRRRPATTRARMREVRTTSASAAMVTIGTFVGVMLGVACRSRENKPSQAPVAAAGASSAVPIPRAPASPPAGGNEIELSVRAKGRPWVTIDRHGDTVTISAGEHHLVGELRADGKRKYSAAAGGPVLLEVKPRSPDDVGSSDATEGFKLRGADGKLLWKVKVGADKIKITADEEGTRAFVISSKHAPSVTVQGLDGQALGTIRANAQTQELVGQDAAGGELFRVTTDLPARYLGVLLVEGVPLRDRGVIVAELAARWRTR